MQMTEQGRILLARRAPGCQVIDQPRFCNVWFQEVPKRRTSKGFKTGADDYTSFSLRWISRCTGINNLRKLEVKNLGEKMVEIHFSGLLLEIPLAELVSTTPTIPQVWKSRPFNKCQNQAQPQNKAPNTNTNTYASALKKDQPIAKTLGSLLQEVTEPRKEKADEVGETDTSASSCQGTSIEKPSFDQTPESSDGNKTLEETLSPESPTQKQEEKMDLNVSTPILPLKRKRSASSQEHHRNCK
ncbi:hypothetical protein CHS0354_014736 [Potamilus streckersoni]|uniref:Uncharacterized protein n=1 Tax=Potamilus streckersoni TaxID=2493646 RepID=A0AAE0SQ00_9BIVA|nr:hypothetical protein CHS0354_014736 [Potamilus streckersoni]